MILCYVSYPMMPKKKILKNVKCIFTDFFSNDEKLSSGHKYLFSFWPLINFMMKLTCLLNLQFYETLCHSVWKSQKKYHSTLPAKRATFTFWVDKSSLKMPKIVHFGEFLKIWSLRSNSVTRQVNFNRSKIGGKCRK